MVFVGAARKSRVPAFAATTGNRMQGKRLSLWPACRVRVTHHRSGGHTRHGQPAAAACCCCGFGCPYSPHAYIYNISNDTINTHTFLINWKIHSEYTQHATHTHTNVYTAYVYINLYIYMYVILYSCVWRVTHCAFQAVCPCCLGISCVLRALF